MSLLTHNAINQIIRQGDSSEDFNPVLQILQVKQVPGATSGVQGERYRLILSDGDLYAQGMLAKQLIHHVHSGELTVHAVIRVKNYLTNVVNNKLVIIILNLDILNNPGNKIGNPVMVNDTVGVGPNAAAAAPMANRPQPQPALITPMYGEIAQPPQHQQQQQQQPTRQPMNVYPTNHHASVQQPTNPYSSATYPTRVPSGSVAIERTGSAVPDANITPIAHLNPYANRWTIKARVINKSEIRTWSNAKGEGSLFSVDLLDSSGFDIRATFFKEAVDKFYHMLQLNQVYTFSGGRIKTANMQYNTCKSGLEISMDQNAEIHLVGNDNSIQQQQYDLTKIADLDVIEPNAHVDIMGIVKSVTPPSTVMSKKTQKELFKAELIVADNSGAQVNVTLWGDRAKTAMSEFANQPLVGFKKLRVSDFGGRSLSVAGGPIMINPNVPEANIIRHWWNTQGAHGAIRSMAGASGAGREATFDERKPIASIQSEHMGFNEKPDYLTFKATINFIKRDKDGGPWYTACANPEPPCKNMCKVTNVGDGNWYCDRCQQTRAECVRRYIFSGTVIDDSCTSWVSIFNDQALQLLGEENTADRLYQLYFEQADTEMGFEGTFHKAMFSDWIFKCKVKQEIVGDENRIKASIVDMQPVDYVKESKNILAAIARMS